MLILSFCQTFLLHQVKRVVKHPRYSQTNYDNDIALIQLDEPVKFEGIFNPVCLPVPKKSFSGDDVIINLAKSRREINSNF